jgi:hypothetical protein
MVALRLLAVLAVGLLLGSYPVATMVALPLGVVMAATALLMITVVLATAAVVSALASRERNRVPCPQCAEDIRLDALVCPFCRSNLASPGDILQRGRRDDRAK